MRDTGLLHILNRANILFDDKIKILSRFKRKKVLFVDMIERTMLLCIDKYMLEYLLYTVMMPVPTNYNIAELKKLFLDHIKIR